MATVIAISNRKGGVGKSTMASHIAAGLAIKGHNVGLVDTDSQGHGGLMLGMPSEDMLYQMLITKAPLGDVVRHVPAEHYAPEAINGNLWIIPSSQMTYQIPYQLQQHETFLFLEKLEEFTNLKALDVIIIDTNPSLSLFDGAIYLAADSFVYVTECEGLSLDGVQQAYQQLELFRKQRQRYLQRDSYVMGIIPNKYRSSTVLHEYNVNDLREAFGDRVWEPVNLRVSWSYSGNLYKPLFVYEPQGAATSEAWYIVEKVEEGIRAWQSQTA